MSAPPAYQAYQARLDDIPPCYDPDKAIAELNALSADQKVALSKGVARASTGDDAIQQFKAAAAGAADAAERIEQMFVDLTAKLMNLEDTEDFVKSFKVIQQVVHKFSSLQRHGNELTSTPNAALPNRRVELA